MAKIGPAGQTMAQLRQAERTAWRAYQARPTAGNRRAYEDASRLLRAASIRASR